MAATDPIRDKRNVKKMADYFLKQGQPRNHLLIIAGIYTALRISDLLRLTWDDVFDFASGCYRTHISLVEQKTQKPKTIALNKEIIRALALLAAIPGKQAPGRFLFESNRKTRAAISRVQAYRLVREAAEAIRLQGHISCHSLRKTFGYHAWKAGVAIPVIMDIYNHSSFEITRRYLGVCQDDRDKVYMNMAFS